MKKAEFDKLTADMMAANKEFVTFMERFSQSGAVVRAMSPEEFKRATELLNRRNDLERKWLEIVHSGGAIE